MNKKKIEAASIECGQHGASITSAFELELLKNTAKYKFEEEKE